MASQFDHLRAPSGPTVDQQRHAAEARAQALADELADAAIERQRLETALADSQARTQEAEREARALKRRFAAADEQRIRTEVRAEMRQEYFGQDRDRRRAEVEEVASVLRDPTDAQALARKVITAAAKARGEIDPGFVVREGTSPEDAAFALQVANAQRKAMGLPLWKAETDDTDTMKWPRPAKAPSQVDEEDDEREDANNMQDPDKRDPSAWHTMPRSAKILALAVVNAGRRQKGLAPLARLVQDEEIVPGGVVPRERRSARDGGS
jgi:hypothetical protein